MTLVDVAESTAPSRTKSTARIPRGAWWLPGPHLPTIYGKFFGKRALPPLTRERIETRDGDTIAIERLQGTQGAPRLIVLPGLEGGMHSAYVRGFLGEAVRREWSAAIVLWRTCDGNPVNAVRRSYHSGASDDAGFAIDHILSDGPERDTFIVGVSLGGNVLLKWLGERGSKLPGAIRAAAAVSVPFDLAAASRRIDSGLSRMYGRYFLRSLRTKTVAKFERFPDLADRAAVQRASSLWEFDNVVTAPVHGFADAADYYHRSSSIHYLGSIQTPTLLLNAKNDPFLPADILERVREVTRHNSFVERVFPPTGGHVGFITGAIPFRGESWMESFCMSWLMERL